MSDFLLSHAYRGNGTGNFSNEDVYSLYATTLVNIKTTVTSILIFCSFAGGQQQSTFWSHRTFLHQFDLRICFLLHFKFCVHLESEASMLLSLQVKGHLKLWENLLPKCAHLTAYRLFHHLCQMLTLNRPCLCLKNL
jgi:hypothetical protein